MRRLLLALQLLTRIPVLVRGGVSGRDLGGATAFFPVVGALQGLVIAGAAALLLRVYPPGIVGAAAVAILAVMSGGLHLDGLADTFDALGVKATGDAARDRERRLAAMRDSATGAMGTIAIVLALLLKSLLVGFLLDARSPAAGYVTLLLMPVGSKWAMVAALHHGVPARPDGLGRTFGEHCTRGTLLLAAGLSILIFVCVTVLLCRGREASAGVGAAAGAISWGGFYLFSRLFVRWSARKFGGISGDTVGAMGELSDIMFLAAVGPWLRSSI